jgi:hypothetical protein
MITIWSKILEPASYGHGIWKKIGSCLCYFNTGLLWLAWALKAHLLWFLFSWVLPAQEPGTLQIRTPSWGSHSSLSQPTQSLSPFPRKWLCGKVNSWVWGIMVFFCFVLRDLMHRKLPRSPNNYSKTTLLLSRGHSRQAGALRLQSQCCDRKMGKGRNPESATSDRTTGTAWHSLGRSGKKDPPARPVTCLT